MRKIPTIFDRNWEGDKRVIDKYVIEPELIQSAIATEKLDGTNVRLTIRNHTLVRLEKRRNPDKMQKAKGITEPWYVDADEYDKGDQYIWEAARNADIGNVEDGEWSGEALGPGIQGNPLSIDKHIVVIFSAGQAPVLENVPTTYDELKAYFSKIGKKGGKKTAERGEEYYRKIAKKRWKNRKQAVHNSPLRDATSLVSSK